MVTTDRQAGENRGWPHCGNQSRSLPPVNRRRPQSSQLELCHRHAGAEEQQQLEPARHRWLVARLKGKGASLPDPAMPVAPANFPLVVQLLNSETSTCLQSSFASGDVVKNDAGQLKVKH
jgi:hypothetical protein